ncbi:MAG: phytanoyl-CoA dioxygenase family protein [Candidatus Latescibacteria bacterium]|nr:phytanoyl-CoA dioxygenase family protein [Candidatus Latescibacterota bacterium]
MLSDAQIKTFRERGFLKVGRVLDDDQVERLRERLDLVIAGQSQSNPELLRNLKGGDLDAEQVVIQIVNIWEADDLFQALTYNPTICEMATDLIGTDTLRVWHDQIQYKPSRKGGSTDWHQDHPYWPIIQPADLVSAWVALDDATTENGCMRMVPRSHLWGPHKGGTVGTKADDFSPDPDLSLLPPNESVEIVPCEVMKGECMFHHCLTWHGSPPNPSDKPRRAIAIHYMPGYTRYEPVGGHVMEVRVDVKPGEILKGEYFPTVWEKGPLTPGVRE